MVTRHFRCGRSMTIFDTAACLRSSISDWRMLISSWRSRPYSPLLANQRESQVRLMPSRSPIGLTFWPIRRSPSSGALLWALADDYCEMCKMLFDPRRAAATARMKPLHHKRAADRGFLDVKPVDVELMVVLG